MFGLGAGELFLIFLIALFFLGPKKLPELAKGLGSAVREFNKAKDHMMKEITRQEDEVKSETKPASNIIAKSDTIEKLTDDSKASEEKKPESHS